MFVCGIMLLASIALMAPFLQNVLGYPIVDAGWLLGTRGIGMAFAMLGAGRLLNRVGPRSLLTLGLLCNVVSLYYSTGFGVNTHTWTIVWTSMLQGLGLGLLFVPLNTIALSTLPPALRTEGTALWTLIRNMGSSIGVSVVIANLSSKTITMHARLAELVTPFNLGLADPAAEPLNPATDMGRALLDQLLTQQATIIAYTNDFKMMMVMSMLAFPLILFVRQEAFPARQAMSQAR
jgi:DHA2 family multidrug resistance protein